MGYYLYLIFVISYFLRLPSRIPILAYMRFDFVLMASTVFIILVETIRTRFSWGTFQTSRSLLWLIGFILVSLPLVEWPGSAIRSGLPALAKMLFFFAATVVLINTEKELKTFMSVFILCQTVRIIEPAYLHVTMGYWGSSAHSVFEGVGRGLERLSGAPHDVINPNQLAWVIVSTIPFLYYLGWRRGGKARWAIGGVFGIGLYALFLTGSRSGIVSLFALVIAMGFLSRRKMKGIAIAAFAIAGIVILMGKSLSPELKERYVSIVDRDVRGGGTANGRIEAMYASLGTVWNKALVGHGIGTSHEVNANVLHIGFRITHNLYIEVLQELGLVGFIIFMAYILNVTRSLREARRTLQFPGGQDSWMVGLVTATQAWIAMDLVYSLTYAGLKSWEWYLFGGIATVCLKLARDYGFAQEQVDELETQPSYA